MTVNTAGTINVGNVESNSGSMPSGIAAGFYDNGTATRAVNGTVIVNNAAAITVAGGRGIDGYTYGNGDVTVNDSGNVTVNGSAIRASSAATTTVESSEYGVQAWADGGGTGNVAINIYSGATIKVSSTSPTITNPIYGVFAFSTDDGNISVINSGSSITSSGVGIDAVNEELPSATETATTSGATSISSSTLNFASTPAWIGYGMPVYDVTTAKKVGTVIATTSTTARWQRTRQMRLVAATRCGSARLRPPTARLRPRAPPSVSFRRRHGLQPVCLFTMSRPARPSGPCPRPRARRSR